MFDLQKDIDKYKGVPPYASELYGVYQPLLGWRSRLTASWLRQPGQPIDPRIKRILDANIKPGPDKVDENFQTTPLEPGAGRPRFRVFLVGQFESELLRLIEPNVEAFANQNGGRLPAGAEWRQVIDINSFVDPNDGELRRTSEVHRSQLMPLYHAGHREEFKSLLLQAMQYEFLSSPPS